MHEIRSPRRYRKPKCARCEIDSAGFEGFEIRRRRPSNPPDYFLLSSETIRTPLSYSRIAYSVIALNHPIIRAFPRCRYRAPPPFSTLAPRKGPVSKSLRLLSLFQASNRNNLRLRSKVDTAWLIVRFVRNGVIYVMFFPSFSRFVVIVEEEDSSDPFIFTDKRDSSVCTRDSPTYSSFSVPFRPTFFSSNRLLIVNFEVYRSLNNKARGDSSGRRSLIRVTGIETFIESITWRRGGRNGEGHSSWRADIPCAYKKRSFVRSLVPFRVEERNGVDPRARIRRGGGGGEQRYRRAPHRTIHVLRTAAKDTWYRAKPRTRRGFLRPPKSLHPPLYPPRYIEPSLSPLRLPKRFLVTRSE